MNILLIAVAVTIILAIMFQSKGTGLSVIPNSNDFGKFERRGPEKIIHQMTIGLVIVFVGLALATYFLG